jgi:DNA-binding IclR family transcriptional regulator
MTVSNRSLERGLAVLECFRPGISTLTHGEVSERTGLPKPTVTRLLGTLRDQGYLAFDEQRRGYRLGIAVLSLSRCLTLASGLHAEMAPAIRRIAQNTRTIIGFGTAHDTDIVYLEAFNGDPGRSSRQVGAGMRAPIATTSVGHGYLAGLTIAERERLLTRLSAAGHPKTRVRQVIERSVREVREHGFCVVPYAEGQQAAIGAPIRMLHAPLHAIGIGYVVPSGCTPQEVPTNIVDALHQLVGLAAAWEAGR